MRTLYSLTNGRTVTNPFAYRMVFFDRVEGLLPQALAWTPQSTIALLISLIHMAFDEIEFVQVQLQQYDSLMGIYPTVKEEECLQKMNEAWQIVVPYADPLVIGMGLKTSTTSWGDCSKRKWSV